MNNMPSIPENLELDYVTHLDYPIPPQEIIDECLAQLDIEEPFYNMYYTKSSFPGSKDDVRAQEYPDGHLGFNATQEIYEYVKDRPGRFANFTLRRMPPKTSAWLDEHVIPKFKDKFKVTFKELVCVFDGTVIYPHTDTPYAVVNFMVDTAGEGAVTQFYKRKPEFEGTTTYECNVYPYERIDLVEEHIIKKGEWVMLNVRELHSVDNMDPQGRRIIIQMSVEPLNAV